MIIMFIYNPMIYYIWYKIKIGWEQCYQFNVLLMFFYLQV